MAIIANKHGKHFSKCVLVPTSLFMSFHFMWHMGLEGDGIGEGNLVGPWCPLVQLVSSLPQEPLCGHTLPLSPPSTSLVLLAQGFQPWLYGNSFWSFKKHCVDPTLI